MIDKRPEAGRILVSQLHGEAKHHARWRELSRDEETAAVAALRELAAGRADLLAEVAGILEGASEGELDQPLKRQAAMLCRKAGADPEAIPGWIEVGRERRANAGRPPFSAPNYRHHPGRPGGALWPTWRRWIGSSASSRNSPQLACVVRAAVVRPRHLVRADWRRSR
jgi:hypothetical protein